MWFMDAEVNANTLEYRQETGVCDMSIGRGRQRAKKVARSLRSQRGYFSWGLKAV